MLLRFACVHAVEAFVGLPHHDYRALATRNAAGLYVVGKSKSSSAATSADAAAATAAKTKAKDGARRSSGAEEARGKAALATLQAYYSPWQRKLRELVSQRNLSLLADANLTALTA